MTKPLKIAPWVVPEDLQAIYDLVNNFPRNFAPMQGRGFAEKQTLTQLR
jgi:hypothetical protein